MWRMTKVMEKLSVHSCTRPRCVHVCKLQDDSLHFSPHFTCWHFPALYTCRPLKEHSTCEIGRWEKGTERRGDWEWITRNRHWNLPANRSQDYVSVVVFRTLYIPSWKVFRIGTVRYNWPMSAQAFSIAHCTDSEDLPPSFLHFMTREKAISILYSVKMLIDLALSQHQRLPSVIHRSRQVCSVPLVTHRVLQKKYVFSVWRGLKYDWRKD